MAYPGHVVRYALAVLALACSLPAQAPGGGGSEPASGARPVSADAAAVERLQRELCHARLRRVAALRAGAPAPPPAAPLADVPALMDALVRRDGPALHALVEPLLLRGAEGYQVLHDFFHRADVEHEKILTLTHDPQLLHALLRLTAFHPEEVAELVRHLMRVTRDRPASFIRREIYNFVPVFLQHHRGCFPELRKELQDDIVFQIENGGEYLYKVIYALRELQFEAPDSAYLKLLSDPRARAAQSSALAHLASRGPDGLRILARHAQEAKDPSVPSVRQALRIIGEKEASEEPEILAPFLGDPRPEIRRAARQGWLSRPRGESSLPRIIEYLEAEEDPRAREILLSLIRRYSPGLLGPLRARAGEVRDPRLKEALLAEKVQVAAGTKPAAAAPPEDAGSRPASEDLSATIARLESMLREEGSAAPPGAATPPSPAGGAVPTRDAGDAGLMSRPGTGDRAAVADLLALFERRNAPALAASLERWLARGDAAHETLRDFIFELDRKPFEELATIKSYQVSFAIIHPAMLREAETARFIHYFLAASRNVPSSAARVLLLEWAPIFVRYHGARFADLRDLFEHIVLDGLSAGGEGLPRTYMIMKTLGFVPPIEMIEEQLGKARTVAEIDPLADHLISRNDRDAVRALDRTLSREAAFQDSGAVAMLGALARMTTPEAELALLRYFHSGHAQKRDAAALAYFAVDRGSRVLDIDLALEYLNSPSGVKEKSHWILRMRQLNPGLVEVLRAEADRISIEPIRKALRETPNPRPASPVR